MPLRPALPTNSAAPFTTAAKVGPTENAVLSPASVIVGGAEFFPHPLKGALRVDEMVGASRCDASCLCDIGGSTHVT